MTPQSGSGFFAALRASLALALLACAGPGAAAAGPLRIWDRRVDDETVIVVSNEFYEIMIRPALGATVSSLRFGRQDRTELTHLQPGLPGGLLQEVHTADFPFELVDKRVTSDEISLAFRCAAGPLVVHKRFRFSGDSPSLRVEWAFENRSRLPLTGQDAPAVCNLVLPADGRPTGREYYCAGGACGTRAVTAATVLRELSPFRCAGPLGWLAVTDPVTKRGLGFVFLDAAQCALSAERGPHGAILTRWRCPGVPAGSVLRSELRLVPLEGFAAVSGLTPEFAADTARSRAADGTLGVTLRLMALESDLSDVSVVTRAYGAAGEELKLYETLHYERISAYEPVAGRLVLKEDEPVPAWLQHELYSRGRRVGRLLAPLSAAAPPPTSLAASLPEPRVERAPGVDLAAPGAEIVPDEEAQKRGFVVWQFEGEAARPLQGTVRVALSAQESETIFFAVRALTPIGRLRASIASSEAPGQGLRALHPAAAYLWSVEETADGGAYLVPFTERKLAPDETVWIALTVGASRLAPGLYSARLFLDGGAGAVEAPIQVRVSSRALASREGFALWFLDAGGGDAALGGAAPSKLAGYTVSALALRVDDQGPAPSPLSALEAAEGARLDMLGFHSAGRGTDGAARMMAAWGNRAAALPAAEPVWVLWKGTDDLGAVEHLRAQGFSVAVVLPRLTALEGRARGLRAAPDHWLVAGGCAPGAVASLVQAGVVGPEQSVWLFLDLRGVDWRRAAVELRSAFWAGAWQGLAGAAVLCPRPEGRVDRQSVLWHVLRDAREEAALGIGAVREGARMLDWVPDVDALTLQQAKMIGESRSLVGNGAECLVRVETERRPFRQVYRARVPEGLEELPLAAYHEAKRRAISILQETGKLSAGADRWGNLFWHGVPLLVDGRVSWVIWTGGIAALRTTAERLQQGVRERTGLSVPIVREFPAVHGDAEGGPLRLVWVITDGEAASGLPEAVRRVAAGEHRLSAVSLGGAALAVVVRRDMDVEAIVRSFLPSPTPYPKARDVK